MATTGTFNFSPEIAEITDEAFERAGIDPEVLTGRHLRSARRSMDFMFSEWANDGIKLWQIDQQTVTLVAGTPTYNCPAGTIALLEVFARDANGIDTMLSPLARDEYAYMPTKSAQGFPSQYYFDRKVTTPTITLWQVPDAVSATTLVYYRLRQPYNVGAASNTPDIPFRWQDAFVSGIAARLAAKFNPDREGSLTAKYYTAYELAKTEDRERTPTRIRVNYR